MDWPAFREGRVPTATCCGCWELLPFDAFDYHQWERARANDRAKCLGCKVPGGNGPKRRKIDSGSQKHICDGCKITKVEEAFPRAQLQQDESGMSGSSASSAAEAKRITSNVANARPLLPCTAGSGRTWPRCRRHGSPVRHAKMKHSRRLRDPGNTQNGSNAVAVARCSQPHPSPASPTTKENGGARTARPEAHGQKVSKPAEAASASGPKPSPRMEKGASASAPPAEKDDSCGGGGQQRHRSLQLHMASDA